MVKFVYDDTEVNLVGPGTSFALDRVSIAGNCPVTTGEFSANILRTAVEGCSATEVVVFSFIPTIPAIDMRFESTGDTVVQKWMPVQVDE